MAADPEPGSRLLKDGDLEFRTKSVEEALAPLIEQVQTFRGDSVMGNYVDESCRHSSNSIHMKHTVALRVQI